MPTSIKKLCSYFFIGTLLLTTVQITVVGFQADENSWFEVLTTVMAEEENEDAQQEEEAKSSKKFMAASVHFALLESNKYFQSIGRHFRYLVESYEVLSPPPQV